MWALSPFARSFLYILPGKEITFQNKQVNTIKENQIRQAWNFPTQVKTYPDEVQGKLWCSTALEGVHMEWRSTVGSLLVTTMPWVCGRNRFYT